MWTSTSTSTSQSGFPSVTWNLQREKINKVQLVPSGHQVSRQWCIKDITGNSFKFHHGVWVMKKNKFTEIQPAVHRGLVRGRQSPRHPQAGCLWALFSNSPHQRGLKEVMRINNLLMMFRKCVNTTRFKRQACPWIWSHEAHHYPLGINASSDPGQSEGS